MKRLVQLSDIHLRADRQALVRGNSPQERFTKAIAAIAEESCDYLLLAGDVSDDGSLESYQRVIDACEMLGCPWGWIPGNHDNPDVMRGCRALLEEVWVGGWRMLGLNSWVSGWDGGELGAVQLEALGHALKASSAPTLIAVHHPPISGVPAWMQKIELRDRDAFMQCVEKNATGPVGVLSGHIHYPVEQHVAGIHIVTSPGCVDQFSSSNDDFAPDGEMLPGYLRIHLGEDDFSSEVARFNP